MPKYRPETARLKAKSLIKSYNKSRLNQTVLAHKEGVSQSAISQRLNKKPVQDTLTEYFNSPELRTKLRTVAKEGLQANRAISAVVGTDATGRTMDFIDVPDHKTRHKFWRDILIIMGHLKPTGNGKGSHVTAVIIRIGNPSELLTEAETEHLSHQRS